MMVYKKWVIQALAVCILFMIAACEKSNRGDNIVKLVMLVDGVELSDTQFATWILEPVARKYPHITIELQKNADGLAGLEYLILKGQFPDMMITEHSRMADHRNMQSALDLTPWIASHNIDLEKFDPTAIELMKMYGEDKKIYGLPFSLDFSALFYNADIFDKARTAFPVDGMNWEEIIELSKRFYQIESERVYGLATPDIDVLGTQLSLHYANPKTGRADFHTDGWIKILLLNKKIQEISGNLQANASGFVERSNTAMLASYSRRIADLEFAHKKGLTMNWDMVQFPSHPEMPNTGLGVSGRFLVISPLSKHKEEAVQVISAVTDQENQLAMSKSGILSALNDPAMKENFGADNEFLHGKNISGVFRSSPAKPFIATENDAIIVAQLAETSKEIIAGKQDINTIFRMAMEKADQKIAAKNGGFK